jgi:SpoVK/Ycf46/Vps4 family AAA+-type ATPase
LYYLTLGQLTDNIFSAKATLNSVLSLAKSWGAIVLLDEADVFLATRTLEDVHRSGLVSVFLRALEYHEGVVFLTTNRAQDFDPAFQSRIHIRLAYPALDVAKRANVWRAHLKRVLDCKNWLAEDYLELRRKFDINGREIANLVRTAIAIASFTGLTLTISDLESLHRLNSVLDSLDSDITTRDQVRQ